ncbi:hypothetical protein DXD49_09365 [Collinsella sp. TM05-38]|mgnify:FL=1|jgi:hypothetical protein|uniref:zinc ribbon domain-containing protein n=1 Tax=Collinsella sp. TM05-38 TaxID=2292341 RepID=UPI000E518B5F|nr:zinc ribbon domain-containing protein [Collinsella sp. TM05-38]RGJ67121.1 hypothetical protein DXD49_09365 [Collinsella sp. TM05-38]
MEALANMLMTLFPAFAFLGIVLFACDRQDKRKIELEKVKAKAEWDRASECFRDDVTQEGFEEIVEAVGRSVKRLEVLSVDGHKVYGTVVSLSGISSWKFVIDFDYEGHLTSDYTVASSNDDSGIAERVAGLIAKGIKTWTPTDRIVRAAFCPYCGAKATGGAAFCSSCGAKLPHVPKRP